MINKKIKSYDKKITTVKQKLLNLGNMRPGSLTEQFYKRGNKKWPYWQISYTQDNKSKTEYVRDEFVKQIKKEILEYKKFKSLVDELVRLNILLSKEKLNLLKQQKK